MKYILKVISLVILFFIAFLVFLPKENIYFKIEQELLKKQIIISDEKLNEKLFGLQVKDMQLNYKGIDSAIINNFDFTSYLFFTKIHMDKIRISKSLKDKIPSEIQKVDIYQNIFSFNKIYIQAKGKFGEFEGFYNIFDKKILGELKPSSSMKSKYRTLLRSFKLENGKYKYELSF